MKKWVLVLIGVFVVLVVSGCLQASDRIPLDMEPAVHVASKEIILDEGVDKSLELKSRSSAFKKPNSESENYSITITYLSSDPQTLMFEVDDEKTIRTIAEKNESCYIDGLECKVDETNCWDETIWSCHMNCPRRETQIGNTSLIERLENCVQDCGFKVSEKCDKVCTKVTEPSTCTYDGICLKDYVFFRVISHGPIGSWNTTRLGVIAVTSYSPCTSKEKLF
jgi:hypothetical protein